MSWNTIAKRLMWTDDRVLCCHGACFEGDGDVRRREEVLSYHLAFSHNIFLTGTEFSPSWEALAEPEVLKKGIIVVVFFLVNVSVILFWFSSERKETIYFLSGRIKAKNLQWLYCQPRPCSNTGRWIINLSLFCCEAWFTGVIPWQAKDEHCWLCVPSIHY